MHSPTLANDFSSHLTLVLTPFQPTLARCASCLSSKSRVLTLLRTLFLSWHSFRRSPRLFSIACGLFVQNTGGGGTSATSPRSLRLCVIICRYLVALLFSSTYKSPLDAYRFATFSVFMHLQIPFSATSLYSHLYKTPGCHPTSRTFPPTVGTLFSGNFPFPQSRVIVLASKGDLLNVSE